MEYISKDMITNTGTNVFERHEKINIQHAQYVNNTEFPHKMILSTFDVEAEFPAIIDLEIDFVTTFFVVNTM